MGRGTLMVIGVTGIYCSGKNYVSNLISKYGFQLIDVDKIGHYALQVKKDEILKEFGKEILKEKSLNNKNSYEIDRKALGKIVFSDAQKLKLLEKIVHPWMIKEVKRQISEYENSIINAALLIEMCLFVLCDYVIGVDVEEDIAIERAIKRDDVSKHEAKVRIQNQIPLKEKKHYVDIVIDNNGTKDDLEKSILNLLRKLGIKVK